MELPPAVRARFRTPPGAPESHVRAVLGPTNTGKTHLAVERMLGHRTGAIGFPLRLLAREVFDRVRKAAGEGAAALVTGEEKIVPPSARYFLCTVEAMPLDRTFDFLAIDEIQLAADRERGHVFTDRLLHARGSQETMFLGSSVLRPLIAKLVPKVEFIERPRLSVLAYDGDKKLTRLPPRTAVVAFSAAEVYALAELIRRERGGAAVVLGALSPRTRNAQVALFQSGDVDYLVATDAIGMGLNMDIAHVAFAGLAKFDGRRRRPLDAAEFAQIAGRAGRHMSNGTFGTTMGAGPMEAPVVDAIENHRFPPARAIFWRNPDLHFASLDALLKSLDARAPHAELIAKRDAPDHQVLAELARDESVRAAARGRDNVRLLWDVAQIPDYRKESPVAHARLLSRIFLALAATGRIDADWAARSLAALDRIDGDIDALTQRIERVRIWRYIAHHQGWMADAEQWQGRARDVEDKLSDALHAHLTQRFVDRRASLLVKRMKESRSLFSRVDESGALEVEGHYVGRLEGLRFTADTVADSEIPHRAVRAASARALAHEIPRRAREIVSAADEAFEIDARGRIMWREAVVAELVPGRSALHPEIAVPTVDGLTEGGRLALRRRFEAWLTSRIEARLRPLVRCERAAEASESSSHERAILHRLTENLGLVPRAMIAAHVDALTPAARKRLAALGVRIGRHGAFLPGLRSARSVALRVLLVGVYGNDRSNARARLEALLRKMPMAIARPKGIPAVAFNCAGYLALDGCALRIDAAERLAEQASVLARQGPFVPTPSLARSVGIPPVMLGEALKGLGFVPDKAAAPGGAGGTGAAFARTGKRPHRKERRKPRADSPFAKLADLVRRP
ncbi:MAG TPA: helicase-related protein [Alphaproteobacteria bacterium]|nr:helicase-related protein [Alphaproteobacteria bacterium]